MWLLADFPAAWQAYLYKNYGENCPKNVFPVEMMFWRGCSYS